MLTKSEKEWLKKREQWAEPHNGYGDEGYFCEHCKMNCFDGCPTEIRDGNIDAFVDAAEFSERVVAKLADPYFPSMDKGSTFECGLFIMPPMDRLRCARIVVEEEMDAET